MSSFGLAVVDLVVIASLDVLFRRRSKILSSLRDRMHPIESLDSVQSECGSWRREFHSEC